MSTLLLFTLRFLQREAINKLYLLSNRKPLFKQKKSIPPSATQWRDGNQKMGAWKRVASRA